MKTPTHATAESPVDGRGLMPVAHATAIARELGLSKAQIETLVAELRNALVPTLLAARRHGTPVPGVERILRLADALVIDR